MRVLHEHEASSRNLPHLSVARLELHDPVKPDCKHPLWRPVPTDFAHDCWKVHEANTRCWIMGRKSEWRFIGKKWHHRHCNIGITEMGFSIACGVDA